MNFFRFKKNVLYAEEIPVLDLINDYGTPLYIYSYRTLIRHLNAYTRAFKDIPHIICFALKANSSGTILRLLANEGSGADIVSGGELYRALKAKVPPKRIVFAGVGKTMDEIELALKKKILMFNVESEQELLTIDKIAGELGTVAPISLRVNPDIDPDTHPYISTGLKKNKFGIPIFRVLDCYKIASSLKNINIVGIHKHIGSQITSTAPFVEALKRLLHLINNLKDNGINIHYLDIGGGLGIRYDKESPPHPLELAKKLKPLLRDKDITLILEPGRTIVGNAGILVSKVLYIKRGDDKDFIIVDAGMNDLLRPSLYNAYHDIVAVIKKRRRYMLADIVGPICESGDFLGKDRRIQSPEQNEYIAVMGAGAYSYSMSSNYNSRPRVAEVLVKDKQHFLIRKRETYSDLIKGEIIPDFLK